MAGKQSTESNGVQDGIERDEGNILEEAESEHPWPLLPAWPLWAGSISRAEVACSQ